MRQRPLAAAPDDDDPRSDPLEQLRARRTALNDFQRLGGLYGALNYAAPLVRLHALCSLLFSSTTAYYNLLAPIVAVFLTSNARAPLFLIAGKLMKKAPGPEVPADATDAAADSAFLQRRLVVSQVLRVVVILAAASATVPVALSDISTATSCGLALPVTSREALIGTGYAALAFFVWSLVHARSEREQLSINPVSDGTHDLSAATEDELFRQMRPSLRAASLGARSVLIGIETLSDVLLFFVHLPSALEHLSAPSTAACSSPLAAAAAALVYGSQHLRFRGEWLLCTVLGLGLVALVLTLEGRLWASLLAAVLFAVARHVHRVGLDVRRFHHQ